MEVSSKTLANIELYPESKPFDQGYLKVSDKHQLYYEVYGNPEGVPAVCLHGGPGAGAWPNRVKYFDPKFYKIILFDQRGTMRSKPFLELEDNNTDALVEDLEKIRKHFKAKKWVVYGGSWGSTLGLAYAEKHPSSLSALILYGVTVMHRTYLPDILTRTKTLFPEEYDAVMLAFPGCKHEEVLDSLYKRVMDPSPSVHMPVARAIAIFITKCGMFSPNPKIISNLLMNDHAVLCVVRLFSHYAKNGFFMKENALMENLDKLKNIPFQIVQGRYDMICPPRTAYKIHQALPHSSLVLVTDGGHSHGELGMAKALTQATENLKAHSEYF